MSAQRILASGASALVVLIVLAIAFHHGSGTSTPPAKTLAPGTLLARDVAGSITLEGPVPDAATKRTIESAAAARFGQANLLSRLQVKAGAAPAAWFASIMASLPKKGSGFGAVDVIATSTKLTVSGRAPSVVAGHTLLQAIETGTSRTVTDKLHVGATVSHGPLQTRIDDAVGGRSIAFNTGSAGITKAGQKVLSALVPVLKGAGSSRIVVGGYTDNVGAAKDNLKLSQARAHSVVVWLTKHGVSAKALVAKGYGAADPIALNTTDAGRQKNRRIAFTVLGG
jgi:OOP family OmpA-OmpF porin